MRRCILAVVFFLALAPSAANAHDVGLVCKQKQGTNKISVEAFFDDETPAAGAKVDVVDSAKKTITSGKTDAKGLWTFEALEPGEYKVMLDAGAGHKAERRIVVRPWDGVPANTGEQTPIQEGPSRQEFTRFPWLKVGVGLGVIGLFGVAFLVSRRKRRLGEPGA
ncbi:MAG: carboxypeptidase regulatory-like domain-containing protein [Planctomycetes bacterium]|nr:carboxypeptidase regulatory-like domain-containing protein [Planctomycetota bacterium]